MTTLERFIHSQIIGAQRHQGAAAPDQEKCMLVRRVAGRSVAAAAGITAGDLIALVDGQIAGRLPLDFMTAEAKERHYVIHSPQRQERLELTSTGIDLGCAIQPTGAAIAAGFDPTKTKAETLELLWEAGDWETLELLATMVLDVERGFFDKLLSRHPRLNDPCYLLRGAALFERGEQREALEIIGDYDRHFSKSWTMNWVAIVRYYQARVAEQAGDRAGATALLEEAFAMYDSDRVAQALGQLTGRRPPKPSNQRGQSFPNYQLPMIVGTRGHLSLFHLLSELAPHQIHVVCLLANYRGNGPYDDFMRAYLSHAVHFAPFWPFLHVITEEPEKHPERPHWFHAEETALTRRLPFAVYHDAEGQLTEQLQPRGSPTCYVLDCQGTILHEGLLTSTDLWESLAATQQR